jgi:hypothetical protein
MKVLYVEIFVSNSQCCSSNGIEMAILRSWVSKMLNPKLNDGENENETECFAILKENDLKKFE